VDAILEGSVLRDGDRVRINAQLIHTGDDSHLWAHSYARDLEDVIALHGDIAHAVASAIHVELTVDEEARLADRRPVDPDAYQAYLTGRYHWNKGSFTGYVKAREHYERALLIEPGYAPARAALAVTYSLLTFWKQLPPEGMETARRHALEALKNDRTEGDAHVAIAIAKTQMDWDWVGAEHDYRRAIQLEPSSSLAHMSYSMFLVDAGRPDEAIDVVRRALELDPFDLNSRISLGMAFDATGRHDEAIDLAYQMLAMEPNNMVAQLILFSNLAAAGVN